MFRRKYIPETFMEGIDTASDVCCNSMYKLYSESAKRVRDHENYSGLFVVIFTKKAIKVSDVFAKLSGMVI